MGLESPSNQELLNNSIAFFVPSCFFFIGRLLNGAVILKRLQIDDYLMCGFFFVYTSLLILINASAHFATNLYPLAQEASILADPADVNNRIIGSIIVIPLEQCMLLSTWGVKVCLLIFLYRMTHQMPRTRKALYALAAYTALGYVVIMICYYAVLCRPFSQYWAMPVDNAECATYSTYSKIQMVFNISSDLFIILLPVSILWRSALPLKRKLLLMVLFSLGCFTIICAILNKYYNFASPETTVYQLWYIREASVAMWVGNIICCWQLVQYIFHLRSFDDKHSGRTVKNERSATASHSIGGHTKDTAWYSRLVRTIAHGHSLGSQSTNMSDGNTVNYYENPQKHGTFADDKRIFDPTATETRTVRTHFTLNRDGDDARLALAYRNENHIV